MVEITNPEAFASTKYPEKYIGGTVSPECFAAMIEARGEEAVKDFCFLTAFMMFWKGDACTARWWTDKYIALEAEELRF